MYCYLTWNLSLESHTIVTTHRKPQIKKCPEGYLPQILSFSVENYSEDLLPIIKPSQWKKITQSLRWNRLFSNPNHQTTIVCFTCRSAHKGTIPLWMGRKRKCETIIWHREIVFYAQKIMGCHREKGREEWNWEGLDRRKEEEGYK